MSVSAWNAAAVGEISLSIIVIAILWMVFLTSVQRWDDLLRLPFLWLKWAFPLFFLYGNPPQNAIGAVSVHKLTFPFSHCLVISP